MKILVTSGTKAGSWKIRGEQLGAAIGADVINNASLEQQQGYDITICVKKPPKQWKPSGVVVWDMLDCWPQPAGNEWSKAQLVDFVAERKKDIGAQHTVAATEQMRVDTCASKTLYHHFRPGQVRNPVRSKVGVVGYEGDPRFLGRWHDLIVDYCQRAGWTFAINPDSLSACDAMVALRDYPHRGYPTAMWKSNVKLVNAQATGTPIICLEEHGYIETSCGEEVWVKKFDDLAFAFELLIPESTRIQKAQRLWEHGQQYSLTNIANEYRSWLESL